MKRSRWVSGSVAAIVLTVGACSSDGPSRMSEDDFLDEMESICSRANRAIGRLELNNPADYVSDVIEIMNDGLDDFADLTPPSDLERDFNDYVDNLREQVDEAENYLDAVEDEDEDAATESSDKLDDLSDDGDEIAEDLNADDCVGVGDTGGPETTDPPTTEPPTTETVTPVTPLPIDTVPETVPPVSEPPITTPEVTEPTSPGGFTAIDASLIWFEPEGYTWGVLDDLEGTTTPFDDTTVGPQLVSYAVGLLESTSGGDGALIYISEFSITDQMLPDDVLQAWLDFELVGDGEDTVLPVSQFPARYKVEAFAGYDGAAFWIPGFGVSVLVPSGGDPLAVLDAFAQAQGVGG